MAKATVRRRAPIPWTGLLLYLSLVFLSTMGVAAADWADQIALIPLVAMLGAVVGILLARSYFGGRFAAVIGLAYGLFTTSVLLADGLDPAFVWRERLLILWARFGVFLNVVAGGLRNQDPLMVVLLLCLLYWGMALYGAWSLFRRRSLWSAVVPLGVALFVNALYYIGPARIDLLLAAFLLLALLLFLYQELNERQHSWQSTRARVPGHVVSYVARAGVLAALALVLLAWAGPAFARSEGAAAVWDTVSAPWRAVRERLGNAVSGLNSPVQFVADEFGGNLTLEAGIEPTDAFVMVAEPLDDLRGPGRYYWRARTYDSYQQGAWSSDLAADLRFNPNEGDIELVDYAGREEVEIEFAIENSVQRILYLPSQPIWVNRTADLQVERSENEVVDVSAVLSVFPIHQGETYQARASIAVPNAAELRAAGDDYPAWVEQRYLQVPATITPRTRELARLIAGNLPTAYDKAEAITAWLRTNIAYQRVTQAPPEGVEPLDWFLFEYSTGFCNYYASAEVIMLRSLGIPARLAVGYARGEFAADRGVYEVYAEDYHAWPEVFFPGYGWVEFEPTASEPVLTRPEPASAAAGDGAADRSGAGSRGELDELRLERLDDLLTQDPASEAGGAQGAALSLPWQPLLAAGLGLAVLAALVWARLDVAWRGSMARAGSWLEERTGLQLFERIARWGGNRSAAAGAYQRWVAWLPRLGLEVDPQQTPHERAAAFSDAYPALAPPADNLVDAYTRERFADEEISEESVRRSWIRFERELLRVWLGRSGERLLDLVQRAPEEDEAKRQPWGLELRG